MEKDTGAAASPAATSNTATTDRALHVLSQLTENTQASIMTVPAASPGGRWSRARSIVLLRWTLYRSPCGHRLCYHIHRLFFGLYLTKSMRCKI
jgi:hypothetical protein